MSQRLDDPGHYLLGHPTHVGLAGSGDGVRNTHSRYIGHAEAVGDKVALGPEIFSNKCNRRDAAFCDVDAVTHGAGSAAASVPVGGDGGLVAVHLIKHGVGSNA